MAAYLLQGKQQIGRLVKEEFYKGKGQKVLDSILDALFETHFDSNSEDWCLWLLSGGQEPDLFLKEVKASNTSQVCGLVWNAHFVAYRCRDCAISPCMSLCADCFINGNHEGHDFNMFRSQAGGACDCGDENVMRRQGFCTNHGSNSVIRQQTLPSELSTIAQTIISRVFLKIVEESISNSGASFEAKQSIRVLFSLLKRLSEYDEFRAYIAEAILMTVPLDSKRMQSQSSSRASLFSPMGPSDSGSSQILSMHGSHQNTYSIEDYSDLDPEDDLGQDFKSISYLDYLMHIMVEFEFPDFLATFMLLLLPERTYKELFTRSFCRNYLAIGKKLSQSDSPELLSNHIVHVSVQLFSSEVLATIMVREENLLDTLITALIEIFGGCLQSNDYITEGSISSVIVANCNHRTLVNHCYWPVTSDLVNILSHKEVVKTLFENDHLLSQWMMHIVMLVTGMNLNTRRISTHVLFESRAYVTSFSVEIESVAAVMWELLRGCIKLKNESNTYILNIIKVTDKALREWCNLVPYKPSKFTATFHLSLHRFYALFISQAIVEFGIDESEAIPQSTFLAQAMEYPLRALVTLSEVKAGWWVYNGAQMRGQAYYYVQCHFCSSMVDLDILFVQIAASKLDPDYFLAMLIERFSVTSWFQFGVPVAPSPARRDVDKETSMVENFLSFILILLSQRVFTGSSEHDQCKKDLAALLCVSDKTHSQLSDMIPSKPGEHSEISKKFETSLEELADFKAPKMESDVMQQGTYSPKDIVWDKHFDYSHILLRFFVASEYQKATKRYSENMADRGLTVHKNCWPPFKDLDEIHPSFRGIYRLLHCRTMQKIIFFVLFKAVNSENSVSELTLTNTIHLLYHALSVPKIEEEAPVSRTTILPSRRMIVAGKYLHYLEKFGNDEADLYEKDESQYPQELTTAFTRYFEDDSFCIDDVVIKFNPFPIKLVAKNLLHVLFGEKDFAVFEPMLAYMHNAVKENLPNDKIFSRHLHNLQFLLSIISEDRYLLLKKLFLHWKRCAATHSLEISMYDFCKTKEDRPGLSKFLQLFTDDYDWLFEIKKVDYGEPATVLDINYTEGSIVDNASVPVVTTSSNATEKASTDERKNENESEEESIHDKQKEDCEVTPSIRRQHSLISVLVSLMETLKQTSRCIPAEIQGESSKQNQSIVAGDGSFQIAQLLLKLHRSKAQNQVLIDKLAPKIGKNGSGSKKRSGILDDKMAEKLERRKKAMDRQKKILQEFMSKQEMFKEQLVSSDAEMDRTEITGVETFSSERQYDCVICGQTSSSTIDRPFGEAVLLQATSVLATRRRHGEYVKMPLDQDQSNAYTCGKYVEGRKTEMIRVFDKAFAGRALELGLDYGVNVQTCGHFLHIDCHQSYFKSLQDEHIKKLNFELPQFDITKGFFNCPFCRQPCNAVLPILPDSVRKRPVRKISRNDNENLADISHLLRKYSETGSLSALTAKALDFTVLTASTAAFMELIHATLKSETNLYPTLYSSQTREEKFLMLVSTIRTCLEIEFTEIKCGLRTHDDRRSCLGNLLEICQFHALSLGGPLQFLWQSLTNGQCAESSRSTEEYNYSRIPLLSYDASSLLIQLVLTWPTWITFDHFRYLIKVLFNLHVMQAFVYTSLTSSNEEFREWQKMGQSLQNSKRHAAYELLSMSSKILSQIRTFSPESGDEFMTGISQSLLSPHAIELNVKESCLPFLQLAASLSHRLFRTPILLHQVQDEFFDLVVHFGLAGEDLAADSNDILPTDCLNWPFVDPKSVIELWCKQFVKAMEDSSGKPMALLPIGLNWSNPRLVQLPTSYDSLFQYYRKQICRTCNIIPDDPAVCLICGALACFRSSCCSSRTGNYECVEHSIECGCGTGIFLIISTSVILIIRSERGSFWGSVYLDSFGEEDKDLKRGKPLFLSNQRYKRLEKQWLTHDFDRTCKTWGLHNGKL